MAPHKLRWLFALVAASILFSSLAQRYLGHVLENPNLDFYDYYLAGQMVHDNPHGPLYEGATNGNPQLKSAPAGSGLDVRARRAGLTDIELYLYPPLLADALAPVTRIPMRPAASLWRLLNLAAVLGSCLLLAHMLRLRVASFEFFTLVALAYSFWPMHEAISLGQVAVFMLLLWAFGVVAYSQGRTAISAVVFALATGVKVTPLLLLPLFLIWKDKRWVAWYAGTLAVLVAAMAAINRPANLRTFVGVMGSMGSSVPAMQNKCLGSLLAWLSFGHLFTITGVQAVLASPHPALSLVGKVVSLGFLVVCLGLVWRRRTLDVTAFDRATTLAVFALVLALSSPVSWRHGYTVALVPLAILWTGALRHGASSLRAWLLAACTFTLGTLAFDLAAQSAAVTGPIRILLAGTWIIFTLLLSLEVLWNNGTQGLMTKTYRWRSLR